MGMDETPCKTKVVTMKQMGYINIKVVTACCNHKGTGCNQETQGSTTIKHIAISQDLNQFPRG